MPDQPENSDVETRPRELDSSRGRELPDADTCRELLRQMALIRRFEEEAGRQYQRAKAGGFLHLAIGEEATIVGTTSVMEPDDYLIGTYRTHGH
ncbi:MAG: thiamine pyrophosphate-dependent enzyme, partial [Solirubrobacterales bacterium]